MKDAFTNNVVLLTGASTGIGREVALQLADQGARLMLAARGRDRLEAVAESCRSRGADALAVSTDVTRPDQCERLVEAALHRHGRIDMLICNAGISQAFPRERTRPARRLTNRYWRRLSARGEYLDAV